MALNIVTADFSKRSRDTRTSQLFQWDYGQILHVTGLDLPTAFEIHFSNEPIVGEAEAHIAEGSYVEIPSKYLESGATVYAFVFLHETDSDGETKYTIIIPVKKRPKPIRTEPTPEEKSIIDEAIVALNNAIERTAESAEQANSSAQDALNYSEDSQRYAQQSLQYSENSEASAERSHESESQAYNYAQRAERAANDADVSEQNARTSELEAKDAADRAEQSAAVSGYMFFEIRENGHLYLDKTHNVDVDFYLSPIDGHLYVTE